MKQCLAYDINLKSTLARSSRQEAKYESPLGHLLLDSSPVYIYVDGSKLLKRKYLKDIPEALSDM